MTYAIDPELAAVVSMLPAGGIDDLPTARTNFAAMMAAMPKPDAAGVLVEDRRIAGPAGAPDVTLRIYRPERQLAPAAVYDVHGGGFVLGDLEVGHAQNITIARELGVVVVGVDYRLAPETPFPGGLEDVYTGLVWLAEHAAELGVDPDRIAIHGSSAGGGLCAGLALLARDRGGPHIAFQYLGVPEIDDRLSSGSMTAFTDTPVWNRPNAIISWNAYLGEGVPGTADVSPYAAPARATDLAGLPPAYVSVMHFDPLRDEGIAYALAMLAAGVTVELHLFPGTFHGSGMAEHAAISRREAGESLAVLRQALAL
jgi:acetyl esterase/lipase